MHCQINTTLETLDLEQREQCKMWQKWLFNLLHSYPFVQKINPSKIMELIVLQRKTGFRFSPIMQKTRPLLCKDTFRSCQETKAHFLPKSWQDSITTSPVESRNLPQTTTENHNFIVIKIDDMISNFIYYREHRSGSSSNNTAKEIKSRYLPSNWNSSTVQVLPPKTTPSFSLVTGVCCCSVFSHFSTSLIYFAFFTGQPYLFSDSI